MKEIAARMRYLFDLIEKLLDVGAMMSRLSRIRVAQIHERQGGVEIHVLVPTRNHCLDWRSDDGIVYCGGGSHAPLLWVNKRS